LYLTPIFQSPSNHKYDTADYCTVDPCFGGNRALEKLVSALHQRGMRIILDGVFNHTGDQFPPFQDLLNRNEASQYRDWFFPQGYPLRQMPEPNYKVCGGAYNLPKINNDLPEVRRFLYGIATHWLKREALIDGWRLDVPWEVSHDFWRGFRQAVKDVRKDAYLVGELWGNPHPWLQGDQFDGAINYPLRELILRFFLQRAIDAGTFQRELDLLAQTCGGAVNMMLNLLGSHDTARILTVAGGNMDAVLQMYTFLFAYPGCPMIYYGDELGMAGGNDPGCRGTMDWKRSRANHILHKWIRGLTRLRKAHTAFRRGNLRVVVVQDRLFGFMRQSREERIVALFNAGFQHEEVKIALPDETGGDWYDCLSGERFAADCGELTICIAARGSRLLTPFAVAAQSSESILNP